MVTTFQFETIATIFAANSANSLTVEDCPMYARYRNLTVLYFVLVISLTVCAAPGGSEAQQSTKERSVHWINKTGTATDVEKGSVKLQFTGAGGFHPAFPTGGVLVDPFYWNPGVLTLATLHSLASDTETIDRHLPPLGDVKAVLAGQAHYDHALDIPYTTTKLAPNTLIYGNVISKNSLAATLASSQVINVEPAMAVDGNGGRSLTISPQLQVFPIKSNHAQQLGPWLLAAGNVEQPRQQLPGDAIDWRSGENFSYLLDLHDDNGLSICRVFIQASASSFPKGLSPDSTLNDGKALDMAVPCAANHQKMERYPEYLPKRMAPQNVALVRWEKFWIPYETGQAIPLPGLDIESPFQRIYSITPHANVSILQRGADMTLSLGMNNGSM